QVRGFGVPAALCAAAAPSENARSAQRVRMLRLPTGFFYAQGVKANVLFFDRKPGAKEPWTKKIWIYDLRTNKEFTLKERRMVRADLDEFVDSYHPQNRHQRKPTWDEKKNPEGRWRVFTYDELIARDKCSLDIFWLRDE